LYYPRIYPEIRKCFKCTCCFVNNFCFEGLITCNYWKPSLDKHAMFDSYKYNPSLISFRKYCRCSWFIHIYIYYTTHKHTLSYVYTYIIILYTYTYVYHDVSYPLQCTRTTSGVHKAPPKKLNFDNPLAFRAFKQTITRSVRWISYYLYIIIIIIIILRIREYIIITTYNISVHVSSRFLVYIYIIFYCY